MENNTTQESVTETTAPVITALPKYQSHKVVTAGKISAIVLEPNGNGGAIVKFVKPEGVYYEDVIVEQEYLDKHTPIAGGYYVVYEDGYLSFSPAEVFEGGYTLEVQS